MHARKTRVMTIVVAALMTLSLSAPAAMAKGHHHHKHHGGGSAASTTSPPSPPPPSTLTQGAFVEGSLGDPSKVDAFTTLTGTAPDTVLTYSQWGSQWTATYAQIKPLIDKARSLGATPVVTWEPWVPGRGTNQPSYSDSQIANGAWDTYIKQWADDAKADGKKIYLRPMHEMNGDWYPWAVGVNGNTPASYIAAFKHIRDIFRNEGASNVLFVWNPNTDSTGSNSGVPLATFWPGSSYVDWIGLDGYNWGTSYSWSKWHSFTDEFKESYDEVAALDSSKPMMVGETGSVEQGGDKAAWIKSAYLTEIPKNFPRFSIVVWFHGSSDVGDTRVDTSSTSLAAYKRVIAR